MQTHLTAPTELIPIVSSRLTLNAPQLIYTIHTSNAESFACNPNDLVIAIQPQSEQRVLALSQQHQQVIDLLLNPSPLAPLHGFMVLASGNTQNLEYASPIINALSPIDNGWMHIGELGACGFVHELWTALINPHSNNSPLDWLKFTTEPTTPNSFTNPNKAPEFIAQISALMAQQQLQSQTLAHLARRYLHNHLQDKAFTPHHTQSPLFDGLLDPELKSLAPITQFAQILAKHLQYS